MGRGGREPLGKEGNKMKNEVLNTVWEAWSGVADLATFSATDAEKTRYRGAAALLREAYEMIADDAENA